MRNSQEFCMPQIQQRPFIYYIGVCEMPEENNPEFTSLPPEYQQRLIEIREDIRSLRQDNSLSLPEAAELCGFSAEEIRAQEEKTAPINVPLLTAAALVYYMLKYGEDKEDIKNRLRNLAS